MVTPARLIRLVLAVSTTVVAAPAHAAWALDPTPVASPEGISVVARRVAGLPDETVTVDFHTGIAVKVCGVSFADDPASMTKCDDTNNEVRSATVTVPRVDPGAANLYWWVGPVEQDYTPTVLSGAVPFTVLGVEATVEPAVAEPGKPVTITLTGRPDKILITTCTMSLGTARAACEGNQAVLTVPTDAPPGGELPLSWEFGYSYDKDKDKGQGKGERTVPVRVGLPPPEFDVRPGTKTAAPGLPFVVTFISLTPGVTVTGCTLTYRTAAKCSRSGVAVVMIPPDIPAAGTVTLPWTLSFISTRPGEKPGSTGGALTIPVVAVQPRFTVTVQPGRAPPGDEVTVAIEPVDTGVTIVGCLAFFPHGREAVCQRSSRRWFTRARIPADALPGATLLRWGVASLAGERPAAADDGVLPFQVLAPVRPSTSTKTSPSPTPSTTPTSPSTSPAAGSSPVFVAVTDPEAAEPGHPVSVTIQPLTTGTTITGCRAAFAGAVASACEQTGARWTTTVTVPDDARPGDLPLHWSVTARDGTRAEGTVTYRVLGSGPPPVPQFDVAPDPASVKPGGHVAVLHRPYDEGVAITGCGAAYTPGGTLAACRDTGRGWVADVVVPENAPPGTGTLFWQVAYARSGGATPGSADGEVGMAVLAVPAQKSTRLGRLWAVAWRSGAGALGLAALIGLRAVRRPFREWRDRHRRGALPPGTAVTLYRPYGPARLAGGEDDDTPRRVIHLTVRRGPPRVVVRREEPP